MTGHDIDRVIRQASASTDSRGELRRMTAHLPGYEQDRIMRIYDNTGSSGVVRRKYAGGFGRPPAGRLDGRRR